MDDTEVKNDRLLHFLSDRYQTLGESRWERSEIEKAFSTLEIIALLEDGVLVRYLDGTIELAHQVSGTLAHMVSLLSHEDLRNLSRYKDLFPL